MGFNFNFRQIDSTQDIGKLINFMARQPLNYPGYDGWLQRSEPELHMAYKQAILAFSDKTLVGDAVYQKHKQLAGTIEIKNLRMHEEIRRRDFGHFILKQIEVEAIKLGYELMVADARASQTDVISLLKFSGFREIARAPLYGSNEEDVVMGKPLKGRNSSSLIKIVSYFS